jgi:predicted phage terminase large subunit-like protein
MPRQDFLNWLEDLVRTDEIEASEEAIRIRCQHDFELFCHIFFPHFTEHPFNKFHRDLFAFYGQSEVATRRVDCAPRGYAKSTVKSLFKPVHDLCYGLQRYILFISATQKQAIGKLKDIRAEILTNDALTSIYGIRFPHKRPAEQSFEVLTDHGSAYLQTVSAGTEIRGIRYREARPSKIILDDVEDSEEVQNEELREKTRNWFFEVVSKLGNERTDIEIVGTVLHRDSLLMNLSRNPAYKTKIYKAVISWADRKDLWDEWRQIYVNLDNDNRETDAKKFYEEHKTEMDLGTEVLWPEKEPYHALMKELIETGRRAFMKEKQNQPLPSGEALFDDIWWYKEDHDRGGVVIEKTGAFIPFEDMQAFGAMDPATGEGSSKTTKLDYTVIASGYKDLKGRLFVHRDWTKRAKPTRYIREIFEQHLLMKYEKFAVETNLYRGLLLENLQRERKLLEAERKKSGLKDWRITIPFYEIESREKKEKRIFTLEPKVNNGWILFNKNLSAEFMEMIENFPVADHDDAPDALEMLWGLVNKRYKPSALNISAMGSV